MSWRVLLTRPRADSEAFASSLRDAGIGIPVLVAPVIDIEAARTLPDLDAYLAIVVTSANAVRALGAGLSGKTVLAVGPQTALAARALGASAVSADGDAADLAALIAARPPRG
jgi:uroporphyrinogen-III synthase